MRRLARRSSGPDPAIARCASTTLVLSYGGARRWRRAVVDTPTRRPPVDFPPHGARRTRSANVAPVRSNADVGPPELAPEAVNGSPSGRMATAGEGPSNRRLRPPSGRPSPLARRGPPLLDWSSGAKHVHGLQRGTRRGQVGGGRRATELRSACRDTSTPDQADACALDRGRTSHEDQAMGRVVLYRLRAELRRRRAPHRAGGARRRAGRRRPRHRRRCPKDIVGLRATPRAGGTSRAAGVTTGRPGGDA